jgi:hypothetical protein
VQLLRQLKSDGLAYRTAGGPGSAPGAGWEVVPKFCFMSVVFRRRKKSSTFVPAASCAAAADNRIAGGALRRVGILLARSVAPAEVAKLLVCSAYYQFCILESGERSVIIQERVAVGYGDVFYEPDQDVVITASI